MPCSRRLKAGRAKPLAEVRLRGEMSMCKPSRGRGTGGARDLIGLPAEQDANSGESAHKDYDHQQNETG